MTVASLLAHGAVGPLDELIQFGIPLAILLALYIWSSRKPKGGAKQ